MGERLRVAHGDVTTHAVDAIVNAANELMLGRSGVDGTIRGLESAGPRAI